MKYLCKKDYHDKFNISNPILEKDEWYNMEIQQNSSESGDNMYDRLLVTYTRKYDSIKYNKAFLRYSFDKYFYTKQELREKVINELLR